MDVDGTFECKIVYKPLFPLTVSVDYLFVHANIDGEDKDMLTVYLRGESIGSIAYILPTYVYTITSRLVTGLERLFNVYYRSKCRVIRGLSIFLCV